VTDFLQYLYGEVKTKRLTVDDALALLRQFQAGARPERTQPQPRGEAGAKLQLIQEGFEEVIAKSFASPIPNTEEIDGVPLARLEAMFCELLMPDA
jgi:hypothetical protein